MLRSYVPGCFFVLLLQTNAFPFRSHERACSGSSRTSLGLGDFVYSNSSSSTGLKTAVHVTLRITLFFLFFDSSSATRNGVRTTRSRQFLNAQSFSRLSSKCRLCRDDIVGVSGVCRPFDDGRCWPLLSL